LALAFNGFGIAFHVLRAPSGQRIGFPDYATDELKKWRAEHLLDIGPLMVQIDAEGEKSHAGFC
jgi:hypothetical protein